MLDKFIFFVSKQPVLIKISDIHQVIFSRIRASITTACTFNMQIVTKHSAWMKHQKSKLKECELTAEAEEAIVALLDKAKLLSQME